MNPSFRQLQAQNAMLIQRLNETNAALRMLHDTTKDCRWCRFKLWLRAKLWRWRSMEKEQA